MAPPPAFGYRARTASGQIRPMTVPGTAAVTPSPRVQSGEWQAVVMSFVYFFCVLTAYYVMRPVREQLSAAVGSTQLPWFYGATFVAMRSSNRWPMSRAASIVGCWPWSSLGSFVQVSRTGQSSLR